MNSFARYEILIPQRYNDGSPIERREFEETWFELLDCFGSFTYEPAPRRGIWTHELERFEDDLVRFILDLDDTVEVEEFIRSFKERLKDRFRQHEIWTVAFPIRII